MAQGYCEEVLDARKAREEEEASAKNVEHQVKATEKQIKDEFQPIIVRHNANVIMFKSLKWLNEEYPKALVLASKEIVNEERELFDGVEINVEQLKLDLLDVEDLETLKTGELIMHPQLAIQAQKDQTKSFGYALCDSTTNVIAPLTSESPSTGKIIPPTDFIVVSDAGKVSETPMASASLSGANTNPSEPSFL